MKEEDNRQQEYQARVDALSKLISGASVFVSKGTMPKSLPAFKMAEILLDAPKFDGQGEADLRLAERYGTTPENVRRTFQVINEIRNVLGSYELTFENTNELAPEVEKTV